MAGRYGSLLPEAAAQNQLQQQAIQQQLDQSGMGTAQFDPTTGQFTGISGTGSGLAGYQQFLDGTYDPATGQGVLGAAQLGDLQGQAAMAGQDAGAQQLTNAQQQADLMSGAAIAGQDAGAQYMGPNAYQQFMSPYQQEVIDTTMQDYQQELDRQQSQLGASAGNAFGGGRFGVAQGELGAQGAQGMASQLAQLRQAGFTQANQLASNAFQQAGQQAGQNVGLLGQGLQGQQSQAAQMQNQVMQNLGLYGQAGQTQAGLAALQPQLAAQQIGQLGQFGAQQQQQAQGLLDTDRAGQKQIAYEPYDRMDFFGNQLAKMTQGYAGTGASFGMQQQAAPSPFSQVLGGIASVAGPAMQTAAAFGYGQ